VTQVTFVRDASHPNRHILFVASCSQREPRTYAGLLRRFDSEGAVETIHSYGYFVGLATAGSLILFVKAFSSDQTQGSSSISAFGRSFIVL
jgi:hypothetical protein